MLNTSPEAIKAMVEEQGEEWTQTTLRLIESGNTEVRPKYVSVDHNGYFNFHDDVDVAHDSMDGGWVHPIPDLVTRDDVETWEYNQPGVQHAI